VGWDWPEDLCLSGVPSEFACIGSVSLGQCVVAVSMASPRGSEELQRVSLATGRIELPVVGVARFWACLPCYEKWIDWVCAISTAMKMGIKKAGGQPANRRPREPYLLYGGDRVI
jgi:hypothetical protein